MDDLLGGFNSPTQPTAVETVIETVVAIFDFEAQADGDLGFKVGEKIDILSKDGDWWTGRKGEKKGVFPFNYVQVQLLITIYHL